jgi:hypothetical protein
MDYVLNVVSMHLKLRIIVRDVEYGKILIKIGVGIFAIKKQGVKGNVQLALTTSPELEWLLV